MIFAFSKNGQLTRHGDRLLFRQSGVKRVIFNPVERTDEKPVGSFPCRQAAIKLFAETIETAEGKREPELAPENWTGS